MPSIVVSEAIEGFTSAESPRTERVWNAGRMGDRLRLNPKGSHEFGFGIWEVSLFFF